MSCNIEWCNSTVSNERHGGFEPSGREAGQGFDTVALACYGKSVSLVQSNTPNVPRKRTSSSLVCRRPLPPAPSGCCTSVILVVQAPATGQNLTGVGESLPRAAADRRLVITDLTYLQYLVQLHACPSHESIFRLSSSSLAFLPLCLLSNISSRLVSSGHPCRPVRPQRIPKTRAYFHYDISPSRFSPPPCSAIRDAAGTWAFWSYLAQRCVSTCYQFRPHRLSSLKGPISSVQYIHNRLVTIQSLPIRRYPTRQTLHDIDIITQGRICAPIS